MKKARYLLIAGLLVLDQVVKYIVRAKMALGQSIPLLDGVFHLTYVQNTGAAFNMFEGMQTFLQVVPFAALIFAVWYMERHLNTHWTQPLALILVISGGLGNLIDRVLMGFVTDMFDFCLIDFPVFNVADIYVSLSVVALFALMIFKYKEEDFDVIYDSCVRFKK